MNAAAQPTGPIVVTGATGSIGRAVMVTAAARRIETVALDRGILTGLHLEALVEQLRAVRPRAIIHLAGATPSRVNPRELEPYAASLRVAERLRDAALSLSVAPHVVHASSAAVYGDRGEESFSETHVLRGTGPYAEAKRDAERLWALAPLTVTALRVFNVCGPGQNASLVNRLIAATPSNPVELRSPDRFVRDYVHVADVAEAFLEAALQAGSHDRILNVGSGVGLSTTELVARLRAAGFPAPNVAVDGPSSWSVANVAAIEHELGWRAHRSLTDSLA